MRIALIGIALLALVGCGITDGDSRGDQVSQLVAAELLIDGRYEVAHENPGILKVDGSSWSATLNSTLGYFDLGGTIGEKSTVETATDEWIADTRRSFHRKTISLPLILRSAKRVYPDGEEVSLDLGEAGTSLVFTRAVINKDTVYVGKLEASYHRDLLDQNDAGEVSYSFRSRLVKRI